MNTCYNPYHFIPVLQRGETQDVYDLARERLGTEAAVATTHARYVGQTHSGRLLCRLTTKTPLVVGAKQTRLENQVADVEPYMVRGRGDNQPRPAIPGSSLRGLISSLVEAGSNSALRVLTRGVYSYRKPFDPKHTLSALGLIARSTDGSLKLKPLALPTLERQNHPGDLVQYKVPQRFHNIFPQPALKVYVPATGSIRMDHGLRTAVACQPNHRCRVPALNYNAQGNLDSHPSLHCKPSRENPQFLVAQDQVPDAPLRDGFLRVLGCWGDRKDLIPQGKKHELWLPEPSNGGPELPIDPRALQRFHQLADERTEASLKAGDPVMPFHPLDTPRNEDPAQFGQRFRVKPGDLVYFDVDNKGTVTEVALSAIWRGRVETRDGQGAGAIEFFQAVDPNLVPFSPARQQITIAEQMFGFVEDMGSGVADEKTARALASRIRFSDALPATAAPCEEVLESEAVILRILSSPKPPSPALYFKCRQRGGRWISKSSLTPDVNVPQGRKMYLHHRKTDSLPWRTRHEDRHLAQKNRVRPVRAGQEFCFHIDYDNLTDAELGLLLYALAPDDAFHHKLGMGKPLGLGSVKIKVEERKSVNRRTRYSRDGLLDDRFERVHTPQADDFWTLRDGVITEGLVPAPIHNAICLLGNFSLAPQSRVIHTPTMHEQSDVEEDTYRWFVANDGKRQQNSQRLSKHQQFLCPLPESNGQLPPLIRPSWQPDDGSSEGRRR